MEVSEPKLPICIMEKRIRPLGLLSGWEELCDLLIRRICISTLGSTRGS